MRRLGGERQCAVRLESGWPAEPPEFPPVAMPDELFVPIGTADAMAPGTLINSGQRLASRVSVSESFPVSPSAGRIESSATASPTASLFDGSIAFACRVRTAVGDSTGKHRPQAGVGPEMLGRWIDVFREHGVHANRHTSPNLIAQCYAALARPVDTVLVNLLDVDPTVPLNAALAATYPQEIRAGVNLLASLTNASRIWAAIDERMPGGWSTSLCDADDADVACKLIPLINDYPQSDPSLLIYALFNRRLRPGRLPVDAGVMVLDAAAAMAVGRVILHGEPMVTVPIAVRDHGNRESHFRTVPVGTPIDALLHALEMPAARWLTLRGGDVLRDIRIRPDGVVSGSELNVHAGLLEPSINPDPCVRCGWCFESCPTLVQPANCLEAAQREDWSLAERSGINGCIECGICTYVCPSHLPVLNAIRSLRAAQQ